MKKFLLSTVALSAVSFGVSARSYMVVNRSDGADSDTFNVSKISEVTFFEVEDPVQGGVTISGSVGAYTYVDLGLPSGTKWATYNLGTNTPLEKGDYYAWGETETKKSFINAAYKYWDADKGAYTKYVSGTSTNPAILDASDDAATANWGAAWCMPTLAQWEELTKNVKFKKVEDFNETGVSGWLGTATNGNTIFFPQTSYSKSSTPESATKNYLYYWTSNSSNTKNATAFGNAGYWSETSMLRSMGLCIRPVVVAAKNLKPTVTDSKGIYDYVDLGLPSGIMWATKNIGATSVTGEGTMYFAWGEVETKTGYAHDYSDYKYFKGTSITKYDDKGDAVLLSEDDAAAVNTGVLRMPTKEEFEELKSACTWTSETSFNGVDAGVFVGVSKFNGAIIVLPLTGEMSDNELLSNGKTGSYWTSTNVKEGIGANAYGVRVQKKIMVINSQIKPNGFAIRGVLAK